MTLPYAFLRIFARSYALDKQGTENDLLRVMNLLGADQYWSNGTVILTRRRLDNILGQLKLGSLSVEEEYAGTAGADDKKTVAVQGEDKPYTT